LVHRFRKREKPPGKRKRKNSEKFSPFFPLFARFVFFARWLREMDGGYESRLEGW
jgi:hypothetical protein